MKNYYVRFSIQRPTYFLTWKDMSSQNGILAAFSSQKLWTAPSKEQYLPVYMKELCEGYMKEKNPRYVLPVKVSVCKRVVQ